MNQEKVREKLITLLGQCFFIWENALLPEKKPFSEAQTDTRLCDFVLEIRLFWL